MGDQPVYLLPKFCNRHGLIAGATGTGKTVTLQSVAEGLSDLGVAVFMADVKGDLTGLAQAGGGNEKVEARYKLIKVDPSYQSYPVRLWDVFGKQGHPVRATISEMGPLLLSRMLDLNDTQEGVLNIAFKVADDQGLLLLDLKDLRALLQLVSENAGDFQSEYGNVSPASVGAIQRQLLVLEQQGAEGFIGEPALQFTDWLGQGEGGKGRINILEASQLMQSPRLYATFLLWMLNELYENMPEVGDLPQPKLVFFFDESHLLFDDCPKQLLEKIEQVVRLIRSKGVGIFFVTQHPLDIPDSVLSQLSNRFQHALRAFTPRDEKAVQTAADTFRANKKFKTEEVITQLEVGQALVSVLGPDGAPTVVEKTYIRPPSSHVGTIGDEGISSIVKQSSLYGKYEQMVDRDSAYEMLNQRHQQEEAQAPEAPPVVERAPARHSDSPLEAMVKSTLRSAGSYLGRTLIRGVLGGLLGKKRF